VIESSDDRAHLRYSAERVVHSQAYLQRIEHLYAHKDEIAHEEVELTRGVVIDRYSAPILVEGKYYGRIWVCRDITHRKRDEAMVRRLSVAVEQCPVSVVITDLSGSITYANRKFLDVTGYSLDEVVGQNPRILKSGQTPPEVYERLWKTISRGGEWRGDFCNRKKNGDLYWEYAVIRLCTTRTARSPTSSPSSKT
jgi:PAS domain S-box-containing protein